MRRRFLIEEKIGSEKIFDGHLLHVKRDTVALPNGSPAVREVIRHIGAVCVIPVLDSGDVIMERQYRYALGNTCYELPCGVIEEGETPLQAAQRELEEMNARSRKRKERCYYKG